MFLQRNRPVRWSFPRYEARLCPHLDGRHKSHYAVYAVRVRVKTVSPPQCRPAKIDRLRMSPGPHNTQSGYQGRRFGQAEEAPVAPSTTIDIVGMIIARSASMMVADQNSRYSEIKRQEKLEHRMRHRRGKLKTWPLVTKFQPYRLKVRQC